MPLYAEQTPLRRRQITRDIAVGTWCAFWIWTGTEVYQLVAKLGGVGRFLRDSPPEVGEPDSRLPGFVQAPVDAINSLSNGVRNAGEAQIDVANDIALLLALIVALVPIVPVLYRHVRKRIAWNSDATAAIALRKSPHFNRLMAQRALVNQPLTSLLDVSEDPVAEVAEGRYDKLAALELKRLGLGGHARGPSGAAR